MSSSLKWEGRSEPSEFHRLLKPLNFWRMQNFEDPNKNSEVIWKYFWEALNGYKSVFMLHSNVFNRTRDRIKRLTNFRQIQGPLIYLWCPIFIGRPMIMCFYDLVNKVVCSITGWQTQQLSYGVVQFLASSPYPPTICNDTTFRNTYTNTNDHDIL